MEKPPVESYQRCIICPRDGETCRLFKSSTEKNPGRMFYSCTRRECKFFKWLDDVNPEEYVNVPFCGGCTAGVCRVRAVKIGPDAGRIMFLCRVKEGEGSCGYRVWKDELELSEMGRFEEPVQCFPLNLTMCDSSSHANEEEKRDNDLVPVIIAASQPCHLLKDQESKLGDKLRTCHKRSRHNQDLKGDSTPLDPLFTVQDEETENHVAITTETSNNLAGESYGGIKSIPICNTERFGAIPFREVPDIPPCREPFHETSPFREVPDIPPCSEPLHETIMTDSISKAFMQAGENLQNDLLTLLESMNYKEHEAMALAAEATFASLDRLNFDYRHVKERVTELIHSAISLTQIEQVTTTGESYQNSTNDCCTERRRLEKVKRARAKAADTMINVKNEIKIMQEKILNAKDWLFMVEAELSCFEVEMSNMECRMEQISRDEDVIEGELEDRRKVFEEREVEHSVAKVEFDRARAMLRG